MLFIILVLVTMICSAQPRVPHQYGLDPNGYARVALHHHAHRRRHIEAMPSSVEHVARNSKSKKHKSHSHQEPDPLGKPIKQDPSDKPSNSTGNPAGNTSTTTPSSTPSSSGCTITSFADVASAVRSCSHLILDSVAVPAGKTLDLSGTPENAVVEFRGTTTFGFAEWKGPLISWKNPGANSWVVGAEGNMVNCGGERWWDGKGGPSGKVKPRAFDIVGPRGGGVKGLYLRNTPVGGEGVRARGSRTELTSRPPPRSHFRQRWPRLHDRWLYD